MKKYHIEIALTLILAASSGACAQGGQQQSASSASNPQCTPVESGTANAPGQKPAFPGQTRACATRSEIAFDITVVAKGLDRPWAVEPLPNGDFLITEKPGRLRIVSAKGESGEPITGLLPVG